VATKKLSLANGCQRTTPPISKTLQLAVTAQAFKEALDINALYYIAAFAVCTAALL
jgi:hypothetical protein